MQHSRHIQRMTLALRACALLYIVCFSLRVFFALAVFAYFALCRLPMLADAFASQARYTLRRYGLPPAAVYALLLTLLILFTLMRQFYRRHAFIRHLMSRSRRKVVVAGVAGSSD